MVTFNSYHILIYCILLCEALKMCECNPDDISIMDVATPRNAMLSAFYKRSFAYYTVKERLPRILTETIDNLVRSKDVIGEKYGLEAKEELKTAIGEISKLKYEIQTNKIIQNLQSNASDIKYYNDYLAKQTNITYFTTILLHTECYMYRRLKDIFALTKHLQDYDYFLYSKELSFNSSLESITQLGSYMLSSLNGGNTTDTKEEFLALLKLNLWGNKCDLSFTGGQVEKCADPFTTVELLQEYILKDQSEEIWDAASDLMASSQIIDIIMDNSGYEAFTDLCIADFLITKGLAQTIRFYVKSIPWFISDVMAVDFNWLLEELKKSDNESLKALSKRWSQYLKKQIWTIIDDNFFTLPVDYTYMAVDAPKLYQQLSEAKLLIFKGDLNYRKLFGEKNWEPSTPCHEALQGFGPSKIAVLRTLKCHIVCGLDKGVSEAVEKIDIDWMVSGKYGIIQFCDQVNVI